VLQSKGLLRSNSAKTTAKRGSRLQVLRTKSYGHVIRECVPWPVVRREREVETRKEGTRFSLLRPRGSGQAGAQEVLIWGGRRESVGREMRRKASSRRNIKRG